MSFLRSNTSSSSASFSQKSSQKKQNEDVDLLLKRIDEQNEQMTRLQNKFRDITAAYKSLLNEKKALEIIVKSIDTKSDTKTQKIIKQNLIQSNQASTGLSASSRSVSNSDISEIDFQTNETVECQSSNEDKIQTLTSNIQLLLDNKTKLEQSYQAEKKKLRTDYEELKLKFDSFKLETEKQNELNESRLKEMKTSLKQSQLEREKLTQELNALIKIKNNEQANKIMSMQEENQTLLFNLRNENNELKTKIKSLNKQFENKCEELVQCETDRKNLILAHDDELKRDENELNFLRKQLKDLNDSNERRVGDLELRIAELCKTIAIYENNKNYDTRENFKDLDEDLLDLKLKSLNINNNYNINDRIQNLTFDQAIEQVSQLKLFIEQTARDLNIKFNFDEIWLRSTNYELSLKLDKEKELEIELEKIKQEYKNLKDEYEKYKIRTNYLIKSAKQQQQQQQKTSNASQQDEDKQKLRDEIDVLKKRIILIEKDNEAETNQLKENYERILEITRQEMREKFEKCELERLKSINELEKELQKQRERTMKLLNEKENELDLYRKEKDINSLFQSSNNMSNSLNNKTDNLDEQINDEPTNRIIYYNESNAYKESELSRLRTAKTDLEYKLKQTLDEHTVDIDRLQSQINVLKNEIERLKLNQSRVELNAENLEYIKNVVFSYMTTKDLNVKLSMMNAISQILKFTKNEKQKIHQVL